MKKDVVAYDRSHALIIGINNYLDAPPLGYAVSDAEEVANALIKNFDFRQHDVHLLINEDATKSSIQKTFLEFSRDGCQENDRLLVFFAGHGHTEVSRRGDIGYLVPYDGTTSDLSSLIRWDSLTRDADLIWAKHVLFIMDACYGGLATKRRALKPGTIRFLKSMLERKSIQVLTAGKADEVVSDLGGPRPNHSVFTGHLLDALDGAAAENGIITANGVMAYVFQNVATDKDSEQTPHYGYLDGDGDFIFNPPDFEKQLIDETKDEDQLITIPSIQTGSEVDQPLATDQRIKNILSNPNGRILLRDFIVEETQSVLDEITSEAFKTHGDWSENEFASRLSKYNKATEELRIIHMLLGYWGDEKQREIMVLPAKRISENIHKANGLSIWIALRWYPVLIILYSCGLGALLSEEYSNLHMLLNSKMPDERKRQGTTTLLQSLYYDYERLGDGFKTLPGHENNYVPVSEYLFKELQPVANDVLFIGREYEMIFDRLELLVSLEHASLDWSHWGPIGRFGWKHKSRGVEVSPLDLLISEAEDAGESWGPLQGGFFDGSMDKFKAVLEKYKPMLDGLNWH